MPGTVNDSPICLFAENVTLPELSEKTGLVQCTLTSLSSSSRTISPGHCSTIGASISKVK